jgi:hypothetical protein
MPLKEGFKKLNIYVEENLHNQFKAAVSMENKTITRVLLDFIKDYVAKHPPEPRRKKSR